MLGPVRQQFLVLADAYALTTGKKPDLVSAGCEDRDAEKGVGGAVHDGYLSEDRTEVSVVGTQEAGSITENDVKGSVPGLRSEIELADRQGVGDRNIRAAVHDSWFVDFSHTFPGL